MSGDGVIHHAVLIFSGDRAFDRAAMRDDIAAAQRATGEPATAAGVSDDPQAVPGATVCTRFDIFAPPERGGTVPPEEFGPGLEVFAEAYPDIAPPAALVSLQVFALDPSVDEATLSAVLAQVVDTLIARTEADLVRLPGHAGLMTSARFRSEFHLARSDAPAADATPGHAVDGIDIFPDIDLVAPELDRVWDRASPRSGARRRTQSAPASDADDAAMPIEARLATWTVNASVAILAPPVGASLAVYNLMRGEDFRLSAHALALTGTFLALGASGMMPSLSGLV
ncbi:hypothetical protein [Rhodosalinus sediminis]|uniref:hypothetical protein n=1 Tax=Rhodosalinus sediminis TaxID=1940533 RepID=UPI002357F2F6|nr:hypothetical protein [Rhodosalinus sediminis]